MIQHDRLLDSKSVIACSLLLFSFRGLCPGFLGTSNKDVRFELLDVGMDVCTFSRLSQS